VRSVGVAPSNFALAQALLAAPGNPTLARAAAERARDASADEFAQAGQHPKPAF
jgi:hypothetical protein